MACGIAVRQLAPLLRDKWDDPPVVVVDAGLNNAISLCGGHHGANELTKRLANTGAYPVITTATEVLHRPSVETIADTLDCEIVNRDSTRAVNSYLLRSDLPVINISGPKVVMVDPDVTVLKKKGVEKEGIGKEEVWGERVGKEGTGKEGKNKKTGVIVGIGTRRDVSSGNVMDAVKKALSECGLKLPDVELFASATIKENESGLIEAIFGMGGQIVYIPAEVINSINVPSGSEAKRLGLKGVCEPCALALSRENKLIMKKKVYDNVTIAIAQ
ncbi:MAG: cobalt-precorrin 5A hydrolase [ANME-2 cluster archaeon]|nr:cobalt-precorrin 5A hydrolase [ANME-2 cluster archaeon]